MTIAHEFCRMLALKGQQSDTVLSLQFLMHRIFPYFTRNLALWIPTASGLRDFPVWEISSVRWPRIHTQNKILPTFEVLQLCPAPDQGYIQSARVKIRTDAFQTCTKLQLAKHWVKFSFCIYKIMTKLKEMNISLSLMKYKLISCTCVLSLIASFRKVENCCYATEEAGLTGLVVVR